MDTSLPWKFSTAITGNRLHLVYAGYLSCGISPRTTSAYIYIGLYFVCFGLVTVSVTVTILVITVCYIKRHTVKDIKLEKSIVKFGSFLLLGNGINFLGQIAPSLISTSVTPQCARLSRWTAFSRSSDLHILHISEYGTHPHSHFVSHFLQSHS